MWDETYADEQRACLQKESEPTEGLQDIVLDAGLLNHILMQIRFSLQTGKGNGGIHPGNLSEPGHLSKGIALGRLAQRGERRGGELEGRGSREHHNGIAVGRLFFILLCRAQGDGGVGVREIAGLREAAADLQQGLFLIAAVSREIRLNPLERLAGIVGQDRGQLCGGLYVPLRQICFIPDIPVSSIIRASKSSVFTLRRAHRSRKVRAGFI